MTLLNRLLIIFFITALFSCGTARGVLYGTGTVLEGVASDVRSVGGWIK